MRSPLLFALLAFPALAAEKGPYERTQDLLMHCDVVSDVAAYAAPYLDKGKSIEQTVPRVSRDTGMPESYVRPVVEQTKALLEREPTALSRVKAKVMARCLDGNI